MPQDPRAAQMYEARLQVGRRLTGWSLAVVVALRNLGRNTLSAATLGALGGVDVTTWLAPSWVVVTCRDTGEEVARLPAGRDAGAGEALMAELKRSLSEMSVDDFRLRWDIGSG